MRKLDVVSVKVAVGTYKSFLEEVIHEVASRRFCGVAPIAIHPLTLSIWDKSYRKAINAIDYVVPDSFWHRFALWFLYGVKTDRRFYGPWLMSEMSKELFLRGYTVFLFGGKNKEVLVKLEKELRVGSLDGEVISYLASFNITDEEVEKLVKKINKTGKKGVLFIGVGSPLQHKILNKLKDRVGVPVVAVGAAFDILSGEEGQCPSVIRKIGFEWFYRLVQNPKRLWVRYAQSLVIFFPVLIWEKLKKVIRPY